MILSTTLILLIVFIAIAASTIAYRYLVVDKKKYQHPLYLNNLHKISEFMNLIQSFDDYVTWVQRDQIKAEYANLGKYFKNKANHYKNEPIVKEFNDIYQDFDKYIVEYNQGYVSSQKEKLKDYFDNIEGKKLDDQQRTALITDEYSNLILAGAGSGKTLTILGKVKYLIEQKGVNPNDILLLSFTKKTVEELNDRLKSLGLVTKATTFHKLGYDILKQYHADIPVLTNENTLKLVIKEYFEKDILNDQKALQAYIQYISCYMNIPEENDKFDSLGEKLDLEKGVDFQTLKSKCETLNIEAKSNLDTIQGEKVKSMEELIIANFLYLNGVEYEYEKPYPYGETVYRPDFHITKHDIYLEHFGVDEHERAKWLTPFNEQKYVEEMQLKRETPNFTYRYIIIDEYQDISFARFNLIKEIRNLTSARLICVGDDWQSIYRFAGSDISLFYNFEKFVGKFEKLLIEQTYRNSQELVDVSSNYILKNPKQIQKNPKSKKDPVADPIKFVHYRHGDVVNVFINEIRRLVNKYGKKSILVLGRHSFDIDDLIKLTSGSRIKYIERTGKLIIKGFEDVDISYLTIHKSKGTEADNVIVLNLKNDILGLPNKVNDDPILSLLLNDNEGYRFAEERRLFYVALTRTKNEVVLLIPPSISLFAEELINDNDYLVDGLEDAPKSTNCTYCMTGKLVLRENPSNGTQF